MRFYYRKIIIFLTFFSVFIFNPHFKYELECLTENNTSQRLADLTIHYEREFFLFLFLFLVFLFLSCLYRQGADVSLSGTRQPLLFLNVYKYRYVYEYVCVCVFMLHYTEYCMLLIPVGGGGSYGAKL